MAKTPTDLATQHDDPEIVAVDSVDEGWMDRRYSGDLIGDCEAVNAMYQESVCKHF